MKRMVELRAHKPCTPAGMRAGAQILVIIIFATLFTAIGEAPARANPATLPLPASADPPSQAASTIAPGWAPQAGTAAYMAAHPTPQPSPSAPPSLYESPTVSDTHAAAPVHPHYVSPGALTAGERAYYSTHDGSYLNPANWAVMIFKSRHLLQVYYKGRLFRPYHAVFGRAQEHGAKLYEGDRRTPEGVYVLTGRHRSPRWRWFLKLDYPNEIDRLRYASLRGDGDTPAAWHGRVIGEGGSIGIHGTDVPLLNAGNVNWTTGCISIDNRAIAQLHRILPIGTVVIIRP